MARQRGSSQTPATSAHGAHARRSPRGPRASGRRASRDGAPALWGGPATPGRVRLRIKDVDFATNQITIRDGKGGKDRRTMLPGAVKADLAKQIERRRALHQRDLRHGAGWVELPW